MLPHQALATVIRTLRTMKGITQAELPADRKHLYKIEAGLSDVTLGMLEQIAETLGVEPVMLVTLVRATELGCSGQTVVDRVVAELREFDRLGGPAEIALQLESGGNKAREVARANRANAIQSCKQKGLTQRETAAELGISKSTVARAW